MSYDTISFLSDYGTVDESVGVVKSVIRSINAHATVLDITHDLPPFDVRHASIVLARAASFLVPGVVLAIVDPGVGTQRRAIAVEVGGGDSVLIGPDNGLFAPVVAMVGGPSRVVELTNTKFQLGNPSHTFAGRDVFGPAAAYVSSGVDLSELGPPIDPATLVAGMLPFSVEQKGEVHVDVLLVDRFGNVVLNVDPEQLESWGEKLMMSIAGQHIAARRVTTFAELADGETGFLVDGAGMVAIVLNQASASQQLGLTAGSALLLRKAL